MAKRRDINPFTYQNKEMFEIERENPSKKEPPKKKGPDAIQEELKLAAYIDGLSDKLEFRGFMKEAHTLDIIANTLEEPWKTNKATMFFDDVSNEGIKPEEAVKIIDIAEEHGLIK